MYLVVCLFACFVVSWFVLRCFVLGVCLLCYVVVCLCVWLLVLRVCLFVRLIVGLIVCTCLFCCRLGLFDWFGLFCLFACVFVCVAWLVGCRFVCVVGCVGLCCA